MIRKKILLLGDFSVGKTSLIRRYVDNAFDDSYLTTIGVKISKKQLTIHGIECELLIWDVEGATPLKRIHESYMLGASGAIFVADCNREETISHLDQHIERFLSVNPNASYVIAYNKSDLLTKQQKEEIVRKEHSLFTSAKEDNNVSNLFITLAEEILR
jgi:small GTP-binding protein